MKTSLKFREDQKPLCRVKVPIKIMGLPFQSGIVTGESKEFTLNLGTFFESGPAVKIAYRPNDSWNPFSVVVKTGSGPFGSPISSSFHMSAEFSLLGRGNPNLMVHFKPQFGDFSLKKSQSASDGKSRVQKSGGSDDDSSIEVVEASAVNDGCFPENGFFCEKKVTMMRQKLLAATALSAVELSARTTVPLSKKAVLNFRWGVRVPSEIKRADGVNAISALRIPFLVMNKIGVEFLEGNSSKPIAKAGPDLKIQGKSDAAVMAESYLSFMRQSELLQHENGLLKKEMEDLRRETYGGNSRFSTGDMNSGKRREIDRNEDKPITAGKKDRRSDHKSSEVNDFSGKSSVGDVTEGVK